jgi:surface protein
MLAMLYHDITGISSFNNAGTDSIKNWDTSKVTNMQSVFGRAIAFNQPIGSWDTSKVTIMSQMFDQSTAFNQDISNWDISLVTNFTSFMYLKNSSNYSAANYDALLIGWASRPVKPNINIDFATIKRTTASDAAKTILTSAPNNWTIADGGLI